VKLVKKVAHICALTLITVKVEYVGQRHTDHLASVLRKYHNITVDWTGAKYAGIDLSWDYCKCTCRCTMDNYIESVLNKYNHPRPTKPQTSPHQHIPINYGDKQQFER